MTSASSRQLVPVVMLVRAGFSWRAHFVRAAQPVHLLGSCSLPRPPFAHNDGLWCRSIRPACHRLRRNVLGLGPD